jgi:hypothetical protein
MTKTPRKKTTNNKPTPNTTANKGDIIVCWCDNGNTDGKFTEGLVYSILTSEVPIKSAMRVQGNQIGRQRQNAFDYWYDHTDWPWILWVDSDIVLTNEALSKVWAEADPTTKPVITGTYFVSKENEQSLMTPYPALFSWTEDKHRIGYVHPLPANALVKVGAAGFGFVVMHRSVAAKMIEVHGRIPFFNETGVGEEFTSEDINFFRLMDQAGIPLYAHTGAVVKHMKRFSFDLEFYKLFWNNNGK